LKETLEITKKEVEQLIELEEESTLLNHFLNVFSRDFRAKGEIKSDRIKLWRQGFWNMTVYPIFILEFNEENHLINITDRLNPIGKIFNVIIFLPLTFFIINHLINDSGFTTNWIFISLLLIFIIGLVLFARMVYNFEKQNQLDKIFELLEIEVDERKIEREWSIKKVITRIFLYPICIGLILLAIFLFFPNDEIILGIGSLSIAGMYLFADIKILLGKKTTGNNAKKNRASKC
jgi:hypothetical protein